METSRLWSLRYFLLPFLLVLFFSAVYFQPNTSFSQEIIVLNYTVHSDNLNNTTTTGNTNIIQSPQTNKYLVNTEKCKIPNVDAWNSEIKPFYKRERYVSCNKHDLLTYIEKNFTHAVLKINTNVAKKYSSAKLKCCYKNIERLNVDVPDDHIRISSCVDFKKELTITDRTVMVTCRDKSEVYSNVHVAVTTNDRISEKIANHDSKNNTKPLSLLIVGIDSISRLNLMRTMPKTYSFLKETGWVEYAGYNKIGDNTFPNLIALLTGKTSSYAYKECNPKVIGKLEKCGFIWKDFRDLGYITAYAEDEAAISTFNYRKKGFTKDPTDFYFRPYAYGASKLKSKVVDEMNYCTGPEMSGERIMNIAKDFSTTFVDYPIFGMFWMNSFSHNMLNSPTRLDIRVLQFFEDLVEASVLENTVIIFLSDHGLRFGKVRQTRTGWLEERLPFLHLWIPPAFRETHPEEYNNLKENAHQLTTPYDLYMTIQDILVLSNLNYTAKMSDGCPKCHSLFKKMPEARSCEDVGIDPHWCTCTGYQPISAKDRLVKEAVRFILDDIENAKVKYNQEKASCAKFKLGKVITSDISTNTNVYQNQTYLLIILETVPEAIFEATVRVGNGTFENTGSISRLDSYKTHSQCAKDSQLKLYCYCKR